MAGSMQDALSPIEYFESALPRILRSRGAQATSLGVNVRFVVTGRGGGTWTIRLRPPAACVVPGAEWKADLTIKITASEMGRMLCGTFDARQAIVAGNIELTGNLAILREVGFLFQGREPTQQTARPKSSRGRSRGINAQTSGQPRAGADSRRRLDANESLDTHDHLPG